MIRKLCMLLAVALAVTGAFLVSPASAQGQQTCPITFVDEPVLEPTPTATAIPVEVDEFDEVDEFTVSDDEVVVGSADATAAHSCADAEPYPGPFTTMPVSPQSPYSAPTGLVPSAPVVVDAVVELPTAGLAHSGSEVFVLAYLGTGLLAFGAVALGIRRGAHFS